MTLTSRQLLLCEIQGRLFEHLARRQVDAKAFIRAFMNSKAAEGLDADYDRMQWAGEAYIFEDVMEESGLKRDQNCPQYDAEALYYGGFITRYWNFLTGESSREIYAQCDENELLESYGFHTEANELAVEDMKAASKGKRTAAKI